METNNRPSYIDELESDHPAIRMGALARIYLAAPATEAGPQDIAVCLNDPDENVRVLAVETLGKWGAKAVIFISKALDSDQPERVRIYAAACLGRMGSEAEPAVLSLSSCLESDNDLLLWHSGFALAKIGTPGGAELKNKLSSDNPKTVMAAVQALGWMEKKALETVEMIQALGEKKDPELTIICASALIRISGDTEDGLTKLLACLEEGDTELKKLHPGNGAVGRPAKEGRDALIPFLSDSVPEIRSETALALARIGHPTPGLVDALIPLISDDNIQVRVNTGIALSVYGPDASLALPDLQIMAEETDPRLSALARAAIQAIAIG